MDEDKGPANPPADGGDGPFKTFDAAAFFQAQQQQKEAQEAARRATLEHLLSSSSDEEDENEEGQTSSGGGADAGQQEQQGDKKKRKQDGDKKQKKHKKKRRKHRSRSRDRERIVELERRHGPDQRTSHVRNWATTFTAAANATQSQQPKPPTTESFYFDRRGDLGNIAFGALYRGDVALYNRHDPTRFAKNFFRSQSITATSFLHLQQQQRPRTRTWSRQAGIIRHATLLEQDTTSTLNVKRYFSPAAVKSENNTGNKKWRRYEIMPTTASAYKQQLHNTTGTAGGTTRENSDRNMRVQIQDMTLPTTTTTYLPLTTTTSSDTNTTTTADTKTGSIGNGEGENNDADKAPLQGETAEEYIYRRTRMFNELTRTQPHTVQLWLDFASFQDEATKLLGRKQGSERAAIEKKVAILEKALEYNPTSDTILLSLLDTAKTILDEPEMELRWRRILSLHPTSPTLWRQYIQYHRTHFTHFQATDIINKYRQALIALHRHLHHLQQQQKPTNTNPTTSSSSNSSSIECVEEEMVGLALEALLFQFQAGYTELAVAAVQVLIEYHFFSPEGWPEDALEMMFEECWRSGAPLVGSSRVSKGWATWLADGTHNNNSASGGNDNSSSSALQRKKKQEKEAAAAAKRKQQQQEEDEEEEEEERKKQEEEKERKEEKGVWVELASSIRNKFGHSLAFDIEQQQQGEHHDDDDDDKSTEEERKEKGEEGGSSDDDDDDDDDSSDSDDGGGKEEEEEEQQQQEVEETDEQLLARLGIDLEEALHNADTFTPPLLTAYIAMERKKTSTQWHYNNKQQQDDDDDVLLEETTTTNVNDDEANPHATVTWRDVQPWLLGLSTPTAKTQLLLGCLRLLGVPLTININIDSSSGSGFGGFGFLPSGSNSVVGRSVVQMDDCIAPVLEYLGLSNTLGGTASGIGSSSGIGEGDWGWLCSELIAAIDVDDNNNNNLNTTTNVKGSTNKKNKSGVLPEGLNTWRWYKEATGGREFVLHLLHALLSLPSPPQSSSSSATTSQQAVFYNSIISPLAVAALLISSEQQQQQQEEEATETANNPITTTTVSSSTKRRDWSAAKAFFQELLSTQRDNLTLWRMYALAEQYSSGSGGGLKGVRKVYQMCLGSVVVGVGGVLGEKEGLGAMVMDKVRLDLQVVSSKPDAPSIPLHTLVSSSSTPTTTIAIAVQTLAWLGSNGTVSLPPLKTKDATIGSTTTNSVGLSGSDIIAARKGFQDVLLSILHRGAENLSWKNVWMIVAAAVFEQLVAVMSGGNGGFAAGLKASIAIYDQIITSLAGDDHHHQHTATTTASLSATLGGFVNTTNNNTTASQMKQAKGGLSSSKPHHLNNNPCLEWLCIEYNRLLIATATEAPWTNIVSPAAACSSILTSLQRFPQSPVLLRLLLERQMMGHAYSKLRWQIHAHCKQYSSVVSWLAAIAVEVSGGSPGRIVQNVLEAAVNDECGNLSPLLWRCYLRFEAYRGRNAAVRRVFLRAINHCPWSKALWVDGLVLMNGYVAAKELTDYLNIMRDKELVVRTDVLEVLLETIDV